VYPPSFRISISRIFAASNCAANFHGVVVPTFVHFVALERGADKDRQHQFPVLPCHLRQREHRPGTRAFTAGADQDDHRVLLHQRLDFAPRFLQGLPGHLGVVPRANAACRAGTDEQPFIGRDIRQREFIGVQEAGGHGTGQTRRVVRVGGLRDRDVALKQRFQGPQNVAAAATRAQKEDVHWAPACLCSVVN
jgi:hypothetical protein